MGNSSSSSGTASGVKNARVQLKADIQDAFAELPGAAARNKSGRKVTSQKFKHAGATGVLSLQEHGLKEFPREILNLTSLKTLDLSSNNLKSLPAQIGSFPKLKTLKLDGNKLSQLPAELGALVSLRDLSVSRNRLEGPESVQSLPLAALTSLNLSGNGSLGHVPLGLRVSAGQSAASLQVLDLSQTGQCTFLEGAISLPVLVELRLDDNFLVGLGPGAAVKQLPKLRILTVRRNKIAACLPQDGSQSICVELFRDSGASSFA